MFERVSVIIPAFNAARYIGEALESVFAQTLPADEVIVIDDGSTDDTVSEATRFPVKLLSQKNRGSAAARNAGVHASRGGLLAFLDADDLWMRDKLKLQRAFLDSQRQSEAVFGMVRNFISPELPAHVRDLLVCDTEAVRGIHAGALLIRRDAFCRVGFFDEDIRVSQFVEWWSRGMRIVRN